MPNGTSPTKFKLRKLLQRRVVVALVSPVPSNWKFWGSFLKSSHQKKPLLIYTLHEKRVFTPYRSHQKAHSNCNAKQISAGSVLAGWEDIPQLRCFAHTAHSPQLFPPAFPVSNSDESVTSRYFFRIVIGEGIFWACASASVKRRAKRFSTTRGFTSCLGFSSSFAFAPTRNSEQEISRGKKSPFCCFAF